MRKCQLCIAVQWHILETNVLASTIIVGFRILDLVEIVLVELPHKGREIGMLEMLRQDCLCELVHVL